MSAPVAPAARYTRPSPRTTELPTAFTAWEFTRGALMAWFVFNLLAPFAVLAWGVVGSLLRGTDPGLNSAPFILIYTPVIAAPWSFGALLVLGAPLAVVLGLAMRRRAYSSAHLRAFTGLGALVGAVTTVAWQWWNWMPRLDRVVYMAGDGSLWAQLDWALIVLMAAVTAAAVANGWRFTMKRALLADVSEPRGGFGLY